MMVVFFNHHGPETIAAYSAHLVAKVVMRNKPGKAKPSPPAKEPPDLRAALDKFESTSGRVTFYRRGRKS